MLQGCSLPSCKDSLSRFQDLSLIKRATANTARLTHDQAGRASLIICDGLGFPLVESRSVRVHKSPRVRGQVRSSNGMRFGKSLWCLASIISSKDSGAYSLLLDDEASDGSYHK